MAKTKATPVVSVASAEKIIKSQTKNKEMLEYKIGDEIIEVEVKQRLSLYESMQFIRGVVDVVIDGGEYHPYLLQYALNELTIRMYTNIRMPQNMDTAYELCCGTDIVNRITLLPEFDYGQYDYMCQCVHDEIEYRKQKAIHNSKADMMYDAVINLVENINQKLESFDTSNIDMNTLSTMLSRVSTMSEKDIVDSMVANAIDEK